MTSSGEQSASRSNRPLGKWGRLPNVLISIALGVLIWGYVDSSRMVTKEVRVPLIVLPLPGWQVDSPTGDVFVKVQVRGSRQIVAGLQGTQMKIEEDIVIAEDNVGVYNREVTINRDKIDGLPANVSVVAIEPEKINIKLSRIVSKDVPVEVVITGTPAKGHSFLRAEIEPGVIEVRESSMLIDRIGPTDTVKTEPIDITGKSGVDTRYVRLQPFTVGDRKIDVYGKVYVRVHIPETPSRRTLDDKLPVQVLSEWPLPPGKGVVLDPPSVILTVSGPELLISKITAKDITVYVDTRSKVPESNGLFKMKCNVLLPDKVMAVKIDPPVVKWLEGKAATSEVRGSLKNKTQSSAKKVEND